MLRLMQHLQTFAAHITPALFAAVLLTLAGCCCMGKERRVPVDRPETAPSTRPAYDAATAAKPAEPKWQSLFDGKTLTNWQSAEYAAQGEPKVQDGAMVLPVGEDLTGIVYTGPTPKVNYEVSFEAKRTDGNDFFAGLTFPYNETHASLIIGGWGGGLVGISSLDGNDASQNATASYREFKDNQWYKIRLRVLPDKFQAWIDDTQVIDEEIRGREVSIRADIGRSKPFGFATWRTTGHLRDIKLRSLSPGEK